MSTRMQDSGSRGQEERPVSWGDADAVVINRDDVSDFNEAYILPESEEIQRSIRNWLKPTNYDAENGEYRKHRASYLPGTGEWLLSSPAFRKWHDGDDVGILWLKGIPGSGKSVMAAALADKLSKEKVPVLYFFFRQIIDANHTPSALLRDWLAQVLPYSPPLQAKIKEYLEEVRPLNNLSMADMWRDLKGALVYLPKVYCVVDALDEMDSGNEAFLQALAEFGKWRPSQVKVVMTSRPVTSVELPLRRESILQIRLEEKLVDRDIASYVAHRLNRSPKQLSPQHCEVIKQAVPGRANGLFLYAKLAMDAFLEEEADVEVVLNNLPTDLHVMYTGLLREHARRSGVPDDQQLLILSFVTHASRPLRLLEVAEMIKTMHDGKGGAVRDLKSIKNLVRAACGPLLEILPDETVSVIHHSLTEFLNGSTRPHAVSDALAAANSYPILDMNSTHNRLALGCLSYIQSGCLDQAKLADDDDYESDSEWGDRYYVAPGVNRGLLVKYPFLTYCLENWHVHARKAESCGLMSTELFESIGRLLSGRNFEALMTLTESGGGGKKPFHITAKLGLSQYATKLIQVDDVDVNMTDSHGETAMSFAAAAGYATVVKVLLAAGAKPNEPSNLDGKRPLHKAAMGDHGEVVALLLAASVDPLTQKASSDPGILCGDPQKTVGHTPLMYATRYGRESATRAFLPYLKDAETVKRALSWAAAGSSRESSNSMIIEAILQNPLVDINAKVRGATPLYLTAQTADFKSTLLLLKTGADPRILCSSQGEEFGRRRKRKANIGDSGLQNQTALHALCGVGRGVRFINGIPDNELSIQELELLQECVSAMLEAGVDVNAKDKSGKTALHYAVLWWPVLVRLLINAGADATLTAPDGSTPLHGCKVPEIIKILVEEGGADVNNRRESDGKTPLLCIEYARGAQDLVRLYAELGADLTLTDHDGKSAMHRILDIRDDTLKSLDTLLAAGVSPDQRDSEGRTPLHYLRGLSGDYELVLRLVKAGADLNARDRRGRTPLFNFVQLAYHNHKFVGQVVPCLGQLVDLGLCIDALDHFGRNVLFSYCEIQRYAGSDHRLLHEFVALGLDLKAQDGEGNTPLHLMLVRERESFRESFLGLYNWLQVNPDQQNYHGQSALHFSLVPHKNTSVDRFASFQNLDLKDHDGIRPIHLAARFSELYVHELLKSGASPTEPTIAGVTPLHVAVRFRKANIVGMLLESIETKSAKNGVAAHINTFYRPGMPTPLHIACRSGAPEIVALLLAAGANPNLANEKVPCPLKWCIQYESEEALWTVPGNSVHDLKWPPTGSSEVSAKDCSRGIRIDDPTRYSDEKEKTCSGLEEISDLLYKYGADIVASKDNSGRTNLDAAIMECEGNDYMVECLLRLRLRLGGHGDMKEQPVESFPSYEKLTAYVRALLLAPQGQPLSGAYQVGASLARRAAASGAFIEATPFEKLWSGENPLKSIQPILDDLLAKHDWDSIRYLFRHGKRLIDMDGGPRVICHLASSGYHWVLRDIITAEEIRKFQVKLQAVLQRSKTDGECLTRNFQDMTPLLNACKSASRNMSMLRFLVEELGVDVNDGYYIWNNGKEYVPVNSAVNICAQAEHWWQVAEALPYLLSRGANLEIKDACGRTTLVWALNWSGKYRLRVAKLLIEAGADVNAVDKDGRNCLALARDDIELTELLISHGATASTLALASAIDSLSAPAVEAVLNAGVDPNAYQLPVENSISTKYGWISARRAELPPVFVAAMHKALCPEYHRKGDTKKKEEEIIRLLLARGADPFAKFTKLSAPQAKDFGHELVALHQILNQGGTSQPFLELPDLDVEHKDPEGRTLLLAACGGEQNPDVPACEIHYNYRDRNIDTVNIKGIAKDRQPSIIEILLEKGASVTARDNKNRNALHNLLEVSSFSGYETLDLLLSLAPELLHQTDINGETPFHYALRRSSSGIKGGLDTKAIEILLQAGANPHQVDADGNTALHQLGKWVSQEGQIHGETDKPREIFKHFVSLGIPINSRNNKGETPVFSYVVHLSEYVRSHDHFEQVKKRQLEALELFARAGADFIVMNNLGETMLHIAAGVDKQPWKGCYTLMEESMFQCFRWLLEKGVDPMIEDTQSRTCLDLAAVKGYHRILKLFERPS
jgi:ankyrin repeat protein